MKVKIINIPNTITGIGILAVFAYIAGYLSDNIYLVLAALLTAGASDVLDGWLARILHQKTFIGLLLDKTRDTMLFIAIIGNLSWIGTPDAIFFIKIMIVAELIMFSITAIAPFKDPSPDHSFHKIRQGAYLIIALYFALSR